MILTKIFIINNFHYFLKIFIIVLLTNIKPIKIFSQESDQSLVKISGNIGIFYDIYSFAEDNYSSFRQRLPNNLFRLNMLAQIDIGKNLKIPININVTNQQILYNLPTLPEESALDYIQNPANNLSINPKYKWAKAFIGTQTPLYSPLSTGDIPIFGAGIELNPGKFLFSASYGISQRAVEPILPLNIPGAYEQRIMAMRFGYGKLDGTKFTINIVKIKDDISSLNDVPANIDPIEGLTISPYFEFKIINKLSVRSETAGSVYTKNVNSSALIEKNYVSDFSDYIIINGSSKSDLAHNTRLDWLGEKFQIGGEIKYVGPGFLPVGFRFVERDIFDYKLNTGFKFFNSKVSLLGSYGIRTNNLQDTKLAKTKRVIANSNLFAQITNQFTISASYSNFGFNNDANLLNQRIELVNNSFTLSPSYQFKTKGMNHQIGLNIGVSSFDQYDVLTNSFLATESNNYSVNYNMIFSSIPLNIILQTIYVENDMPNNNFNMLNYGITGSYKFLDKKILPSISLNVANINQIGFTKDIRTNMRFRVIYKITKKLKFNATYRFTGYIYGSSRPNAILNQNRLQLSLQQQF